jgi:hypothetical protein
MPPTPAPPPLPPVSTVSLHPSNGRNPKAQRHAIPKKLRMTNLTFSTRRSGNAKLSQVDAWVCQRLLQRLCAPTNGLSAALALAVATANDLRRCVRGKFDRKKRDDPSLGSGY